jgi:hypothetical protein
MFILLTKNFFFYKLLSIWLKDAKSDKILFCFFPFADILKLLTRTKAFFYRLHYILSKGELPLSLHILSFKIYIVSIFSASSA